MKENIDIENVVLDTLVQLLHLYLLSWLKRLSFSSCHTNCRQ